MKKRRTTNRFYTIKSLYKGVGFSRLLTIGAGQPKLRKSTKYGYLSAGLSLAPAGKSGYDVCAFSTPGCEALCINYAGQGGIGLDVDLLNPCQRARINRTRLFFTDPERFWFMFDHEMRAHVRMAGWLNLEPDVRPNVFSDLPWERIEHPRAANMFEAFPRVAFHDYTKYPLERRPPASLPGNYHLTMSLSEHNDMDAAYALSRGRNVAVVFRDRVPGEFAGYRVVNGDEHDLRFLDETPCIVGLIVKGNRAKRSESPFIRNSTDLGFRIFEAPYQCG